MARQLCLVLKKIIFFKLFLFSPLIKSFSYAIVFKPSRRGGMVDTIDSKSIAGDCVRVQVSSPVNLRGVAKATPYFFVQEC